MKDIETLNTTVDEWRAEITKLEPRNSPGKTIVELSKELELSPTTLYRHIRKLIQSGRCVTKGGQRTDNRGRRYNVTVYQLIPQKEKK